MSTIEALGSVALHPFAVTLLVLGVLMSAPFVLSAAGIELSHPAAPIACPATAAPASGNAR
jgi:hypothetical protein